MERKLFEASVSGCVNTLNALIREDELILDRVLVTSCFHETPLHIAALRGHLDFSRALLSLKLKLATELDSQGHSPLHLASVEGYVEIVQELLQVSPHMCHVRNRDGRTPLHLAVMKGRDEVIKELIQARPKSIWETIGHGETILHLSIHYNRLEALKLLVEWARDDDKFVNSKDDYGNTILHNAAILKQEEVVKYLLSNTGVKANANAMNNNGLTALDVLDSCPRDLKGMEIRDVLCEAGVRRAKELIAFPPPLQDIVHRKREVSPKLLVSKLLDYYLSQKGANWLEEIHGTLMVVATVIATMSFQAALNPPGGVWQEDTNKGAKCGNPKCIAGTSILAYTYPQSLDLFYTYNTVSFVSSLTIILLLFSGFPLKNKICMWLLTMTMCTTVTFMALTYLKSLDLVTPDPKMREVDRMYRSTVHIWFGLIVAIALSNAIGFLYWLVKKWQNFRHEMPSGPANERQLLDV